MNVDGLRYHVGLGLVAAAMITMTPSASFAQYLGGGTKNHAETQVADLEEMRDKFVGLADAFPEDLYNWRPMEGVRSVKDVLALVAAEGSNFPTMWGFDSAEWVASGGFGAELARLGGRTKGQLIQEVTRSYDHMIAIVNNMTAEQRNQPVNFFGLTTETSTSLTLMANDMHEHLGQLIAYARMNQIVPPWSRQDAN